MRINKIVLRLTGIIAISLVVITSCNKEEQGSDYTYFESKEFLASYSEAELSTLIGFVSVSVPSVEELKPLIAYDIEIYKIIYNTTIDGKDIRVSGVVCVPSTPGEYPVLSFQNGTNTLNASAPSMSATSFSYLLVESIASMGYVVLLSDYPGFGESVQIPHPYLVKEPTVRALVDMMRAVKEMSGTEFPDITMSNDFYLLGYSQGGWATLALHKALELDFADEFELKGSACGAGPYNIYLLLQNMVNVSTYPMPVYLGYIINAYTAYRQFTNPASDIFNPPYASRVSTLYNGTLTFEQINSQLTTSIPALITQDFLTGFPTAPKYAPVREALNANSIAPWHTYKPLFMIHGGSDTQVNPVSTENMYSSMIQAGTSADICKKVIVPGVDHSDGVVPCMVQGILFLNSVRDSE